MIMISIIVTNYSYCYHYHSDDHNYYIIINNIFNFITIIMISYGVHVISYTSCFVPTFSCSFVHININ